MNRCADYQPHPYLFVETSDGWLLEECTNRYVQLPERRDYLYVIRGFIPRVFQIVETAPPLLSSRTISQKPSPSIADYNLITGQRKLVIKEE